MAHSYRHTPVNGNCGNRSERWAKIRDHKIKRARLRKLIAQERYDEAGVDGPGFDIAWKGAEDGKQYVPYPMKVVQYIPDISEQGMNYYGGVWPSLELERKWWKKSMRK